MFARTGPAHPDHHLRDPAARSELDLEAIGRSRRTFCGRRRSSEARLVDRSRENDRMPVSPLRTATWILLVASVIAQQQRDHLARGTRKLTVSYFRYITTDASRSAPSTTLFLARPRSPPSSGTRSAPTLHLSSCSRSIAPSASTPSRKTFPNPPRLSRSLAPVPTRPTRRAKAAAGPDSASRRSRKMQRRRRRCVLGRARPTGAR
jgi:hypothetical protein